MIETPLVNTKDRAIPVLVSLRKRLVELMTQVSQKRGLRPSEKAMWLMQYQQEIEALTLAIMALEHEKVTEGGTDNGHAKTN